MKINLEFNSTARRRILKVTRLISTPMWYLRKTGLTRHSNQIEKLSSKVDLFQEGLLILTSKMLHQLRPSWSYKIEILVNSFLDPHLRERTI